MTRFGLLKQIFITLGKFHKNKYISNIDGILSIRTLQSLLDEALSFPEYSIINVYFETGIVLSNLKVLVVKPVFKRLNPSDSANYQRISLFPCLSKTIELLVKHGILSKSQFGFQEGTSTDDAIFSFLGDLYFSLNAGDVAAAACSFCNAFHCVNH